MSAQNLTVAQVLALSTIASASAKVTRKGERIRFRFRRTDFTALPGVQELLAIGVPVRIYTGSVIMDVANGNVVTKSTTITRAHLTVEVRVAA